MAIVAKVNVKDSIGRATINTPRNTTLVAQNFKPKPNIALAEINDVSTENVANNYVLVYRSDLNGYQTAPLDPNTINLDRITGGTF